MDRLEYDILVQGIKEAEQEADNSYKVVIKKVISNHVQNTLYIASKSCSNFTTRKLV